MSIKVTLRQKDISKGRKSLYLDFYPPIKKINSDKTTRREFLGLYIKTRPKTGVEKQNNKQTLLLAEQICQKRSNELNKPEVYTNFEIAQLEAKEKGERSFLAYFEEQMEKRNGKNYYVWDSSYKYLKDFTNNSLLFSEVTEKFCNDFREYILNAKSKRSTDKKLSQNTMNSYFSKFKATLKQAFKDGFLTSDLNAKIPAIKEGDTKREFLTLEELNILVKTECSDLNLKKACIFSALTGLRFSDIEKLKWKELIEIKDQGYFIQYQQKKTKNNELLPISDQAYQLLGKSEKSEGKVFEGLKYSAHKNKEILKWIADAGINKHITFHCFRHTYATLQITNGTNLYTVSKMLGHKNLKTTQIYAKVVDESKRKAANSIKIDL